MKISKGVLAAVVAVLVLVALAGGLVVKQNSDSQAKQMALVQQQAVAKADAAVAKAKADAAAAAEKVQNAAALAKAQSDAAEAKAQAKAAQDSADAAAKKPPTVIYQVAPQSLTPYTPSYIGGWFGTFPFSTEAQAQGTVYDRVSPTTQSPIVQTISTNSMISIKCSVRGENIQGKDIWDWDGVGWIWDWLVQTPGSVIPPSC